LKSTANDNEKNINPENNKLIWTSGDLKGLSIDFTYQEIEFLGYKSKIEYRKLQVLRYLIDHKGDYITGNQLNQIEEYNSIDMSKSISSIKGSFIKLLMNNFDKETCENLYKQIIDKRKISGIMGYCFVGSDIDYISEEISTIETAEDIQAITPVSEEGEESNETEDLRMKNIQFSYFQKNWFMLFIFLY
jgi:hypothetical protein